MWIKNPALCQWLMLLSTAVLALADVSHLSRRRGEQRAQHVHGNDGRYDANDDGTEWDIRLAVPGEPGQDYPVLAAIPKTGFSCSGKSAGYYADIDANCQVFRICTTGATYGYQSFLCPNGTLFNQEYLVCDWWMHVKCSASENYYKKNDKFVNLKLGSQMMKDVEEMIMYPMINPLDSNSLGVDKMVMQLYNPPSGQIALPFDNNYNYNSAPSGLNGYNPNTNHPLAHYINAASLPPTQYNENAYSASTPSSLYVPQSEPLSEPQQALGQTFSIVPSRELEVTFKKQQYTYPSQYDKQVTYKLSQLANSNQNTLYNLANLHQQQQLAEAQRNLVSEQEKRYKSSDNSDESTHSTTVVSGTLVTKSLIINKEIKTASQASPRLPLSRVSYKTWTPQTTKTSRQYLAPTTTRKYLAPPSARQYQAPTTAPKYLAPLTSPTEERTAPNLAFKSSARLTDARTSTQLKNNDNKDNNNLTFTEILTKETLDDTVNKIVEETSKILEKTPLEKASKIRKEVAMKTSAITSYLPADDFDEANDVENIDQSELEPIKQSEQKSGRLTNAPSNYLEPPTRVTGNVFKNISHLTMLPYYKQKANEQVSVPKYSPPNGPEKSISVKLSLPEKIVSYVLNARNYTNLDHLEVLNTGNTNYLLLTNGNTNRDRKFIPLGKLVFANHFNVSNSQGHALNFLNNAQSSQSHQSSDSEFGSAAIKNLQQNAKLLNEQNKQLLSQLSQLNSQQHTNTVGNPHTFEQLRLQDDHTLTNGAGHKNYVQEFSGQNGLTTRSQFGSSQSGNLISGQTAPQVSGKLITGQTSQLVGGHSGQLNQQGGQLIGNQNSQFSSGQRGQIISGGNSQSNTKIFARGQGVSGQLRQYNENEAVYNPRQDYQITNQQSYTTAAQPNVHSHHANIIAYTQNNQGPTPNQNPPSPNKYSEPVPNDEQNGNFYSSQFLSGNPGETTPQNPNNQQSGKLRLNDQVSSLYQNPETQSNRYQMFQNGQSVDNRNGEYSSGVFGINEQLQYNQALQTTKATIIGNSDVETFSTLEVQGKSGKLQLLPTVTPKQNTVTQVNAYQVANLAGGNMNNPNTFGQYKSVQNNQHDSVSTTRQTPQKENFVTHNGERAYYVNPDVKGQLLNIPQNANSARTSGRYTAQPVESTAPKAEEITTTVQFIPSLSFELNDERGEDNFFAALKNGIVGDEAPISRADLGNSVSRYVSQSDVENIRSPPISSVGYEVSHSVPVQRTQDYKAAPISSYFGPSSYLTPQNSVGKLDSVAPLLAAQRAQPKDFSRAYIPPRLEDLGESVGYPKERPSIPFTF